MRTLLMSAAMAALAAGPMQAQAQQQETIQIRPGFTQVLRVERAIETVAIGNPDVADATVQSDRTVLLSGKKAGDTNLILFDRDGNEFYQATVSVTGRPELGRLAVHSKGGLHRYWAYQCNDKSCWRVKDEFEGPAYDEQRPPSAPAAAVAAAPGTAPAQPAPAAPVGGPLIPSQGQ